MFKNVLIKFQDFEGIPTVSVAALANEAVYKVTSTGQIEKSTGFDMSMANEADTDKAAALYGRASEDVSARIFKVAHDGFYIVGGYEDASKACAELCSAPVSRKAPVADNDNNILSGAFNQSRKWCLNVFNPQAAMGAGVPSMGRGLSLGAPAPLAA